ncbi:MAG TPA: FkbO/Hyg5 family chorismatase [Kineosporiaceae bacterium]
MLTLRTRPVISATFLPADGDTPSSADDDVLGVVTYGTTSGPPANVDGRLLMPVHMARSSAAAFREVWRGRGPATTGRRGDLHYAQDGAFLLCAGWLPPAPRYADAARRAYLDAFALTVDLGYPNIFRMWNVIADINGDNADGLEVYRDFCLGRATAFESFPGRLEMPAATGIGSLGGGIGFYFLSSRDTPRVNVENPRQQPAYRYSQQYGPKPPSFARATCLLPGGPDSPEDCSIFVSGTASIVGQRTVHPDDVRRQCHQTLDNIAELVGGPNLARYGLARRHELEELTNIKVYVRHDADLDTVREICGQRFSPLAAIAYLNVDICRSDLLMEIEGIVTGG